MATCKTKKKAVNYQKLWAEPVVIDGKKIPDAEFLEFLDWQLVNDNKDFAYWQYLKAHDKNYRRPTSAELTAAVSKKCK